MEINSALFTHLVFGFAHINTSSYELSIASSSELYVFTESVKKKNPSVITLLSIWGGESEPFVGGEANSSMFFSMVSESSRRKSFIQSSITTARSYGFQGLEIFGANPDTPENMTNMGIFLDEWRAAVDKDLNHNSTSPLILTMGGYYSPVILFPADSFRSLSFDWEKRVRVIDGITQGLLYLQEFSIYTVIHRDLKVSNILLDADMKPRISDFGIARIFRKNEDKANTGRIIGTYGYVPPEYVKRGIYSRKYDIYSFGVLLLQILSGKSNSCLYGDQKNLNLLEYAYNMWKDGNAMDFMDPSLDDASSSCKLIRCLQVALLCVQDKWEDRPSMLEVYSMLKCETEILPIPNVPAYSITKNESEERKFFISNEEFCTANMVTISEVLPR